MLERSSFWVILLLSCGMFAAVYFLLVHPEEAPVTAQQALPVAAGDQEVAWLNPATNTQAWLRFLASLAYLQRQHPDWRLELDERQARPEQSATVPAVGLRWAGATGTLWIRWYKLTSQQGTREWTTALLNRTPPPLVFLGGGSSDRARDLAAELEQHRRPGGDGPLFFVTQATADQVQVKGGSLPLLNVYPERTFRFCFSNQQMAEMLLDFIWHEPGLRPTEGAAFLLAWNDDAYSFDLTTQFRRLLRRGLEPANTNPDQANVLPEVKRTWEKLLPFSISSLDEPNQPESQAVQALAQEVAEGDFQERALMVLPAEVRPARRFLRALFRSDPLLSRHLVVTTGDTVGFNSLYRDRRSQWPIQELPCPLVVFCHRNPADATAGFVAQGYGSRTASLDAAGTDDLLLYADIVRTLIVGEQGPVNLVASPAELAGRIRQLAEKATTPFDRAGNRQPATGEHMVLLEPRWAGERVLPQGVISIFNRAGPSAGWTLQQRIPVDYGPPPPEQTMGD